MNLSLPQLLVPRTPSHPSRPNSVKPSLNILAEPSSRVLCVFRFECLSLVLGLIASDIFVLGVYFLH